MIKQSNVTINVSNLQASISFYTSIGFVEQERWNNHYAQLMAPGIVIGLHPTDAENLMSGSGNVSIGLIADKLEEAKLKLVELSINVQERVEEGGHFLHFNDPDGTALYFIEPRY